MDGRKEAFFAMFNCHSLLSLTQNEYGVVLHICELVCLVIDRLRYEFAPTVLLALCVSIY
jgi:hypothetical protein